jgi:hypothetical protein
MVTDVRQCITKAGLFLNAGLIVLTPLYQAITFAACRNFVFVGICKSDMAPTRTLPPEEMQETLKPIVRTRVIEQKQHINVVQPVIDQTIIQPVNVYHQVSEHPIGGYGHVYAFQSRAAMHTTPCNDCSLDSVTHYYLL